MIDENMQWITPGNAHKLSIARRATTVSEKPTVLWPERNRGYAEGRKGRGLYIFHRPKTTYLTDVTAKPYPSEYKVPKFQKFDGQKGNTKEHVVSFLDFMGPHDQNVDFCKNSRNL